jgi:MoaD family protein
MNIEVLFFGKLRELTAVNRRAIAVKEDGKLADLLEHLNEEYGADFRRQVNNIRSLRILINGREHTLLGGMEAPLKDGDTVVLLPPIFGG